MKKILSLALLVPLAGCMTNAQVPPEQPSSYAYGQAVAQQPLFTPDQLDLLLGSIALYPDPLVAIILPASTNASDIVLAARWLQAGGDPSQSELQPWDDSVQALAHYPEIVRWMDQNLTWTKQLGDAFATEPGDVMAAIQRLRARARAAGTLVSTPQQQVIVDSEGIRILPAQPDVIHIPYYDPSVVYVRNYYTYPPETYFNYSSGLAAGWWLSYSLDWGSRSVWTIDRHDRQRYWREHERDWNRQPPRPRMLPGYPGTVPGHVWHPEPRNDNRPPRTNTRPPQIDTRPAITQRPGWQRGERGDRDERWRDQRRGETAEPAVVGPNAPSTPAPAIPPPVVRDGREGWRSRGSTNGGTPPSDRRAVPPSMGSPIPAQAWQSRGQPPAPNVSPAPQPRPAPPLHTGTPPAPAYRGQSAPPSAPPAPPPPPPAQTQQSAPPSSPPPAQTQSQDSSEQRQPPPRIRPH